MFSYVVERNERKLNEELQSKRIIVFPLFCGEKGRKCRVIANPLLFVSPQSATNMLKLPEMKSEENIFGKNSRFQGQP